MSECDEQGVEYGVQRGRVGRFPWFLMLGVLYVRTVVHGSYAAGLLRPGLLWNNTQRARNCARNCARQSASFTSWEEGVLCQASPMCRR